MSIETIAIASGLVFGAGLIVAKLLIGRALAVRAEKDRR
ncbi:conserved exported hypothetical protein [Magnetospirillum sp. UT-4]|nr:conserved exported hypothetical protein [Magnetospirillum sp. UT-4]